MASELRLDPTMGFQQSRAETVVKNLSEIVDDESTVGKLENAPSGYGFMVAIKTPHDTDKLRNWLKRAGGKLIYSTAIDGGWRIKFGVLNGESE